MLFIAIQGVDESIRLILFLNYSAPHDFLIFESELHLVVSTYHQKCIQPIMHLEKKF